MNCLREIFIYNRLMSPPFKGASPLSGFMEFVRWRRKPLWMPTAPSKLFRVPVRPKISPEEDAELLRLNNNYRTQMNSVAKYFRLEAQRRQATSTEDHFVLTPEQEEAEFQRCLQENNAWNEQIAKERNERLQRQLEARKVYSAKRIEAAKLKEARYIESMEAIVRHEKEEAKTFITRDRLDEAINAAVTTPVDYNFSIDLQGNIYHGRTALPGGTSDSMSSTTKLVEELLEAEN